jgi:glucosylceramidase
VVAHAAKFVPDGSVRVESSQEGELGTVAFKTPEGKIVLLVANKGKTIKEFNISFNGKYLHTSLPSGSVGTYVWQ